MMVLPYSPPRIKGCQRVRRPAVNSSRRCCAGSRTVVYATSSVAASPMMASFAAGSVQTYLQLASTVGSPRELELLLQRMVSEEILLTFVMEAAETESTCREIALHSYRHSNGFEKVVLAAED